MPIYEYRCPKCGVFEVSQRITEQPLARCPTCKGKVSKLISSTSFTLKGSGWYATDYAAKGKSEAASSDSKDSPGKDASTKDSSSKEPAKGPASSKTEASAA